MSLYLKYRPQTFDELSGQDFISTTLKNAIKENKLVWAYLFTWPRWTGKTSSARIFARSINCTNIHDGNPCLACDNCVSFSENKLIDIIEIDAASHTGVDNIRDIIEKAQFSPNKTKYKVYIIDEVHMLSKGAFNALLKILEEPPEHVKFILATTEINKVPETILSRCQRYDFKSIDNTAISKRLLHIAENEQIHIDEKALNYVTKNANGWLRNAINLFEQLISGGKIVYDDIINNLWITEDDTLKLFLEKIENKDLTLIEEYEKLIHSGKNLKIFFKDLIYFTKETILEKIKSWNSFWNLLHILETLDETYSKTKNTLDEKITFLTGLLKLISNEHHHEVIVPKQEKGVKVENTFVKKEEPKKDEKKEEIDPFFIEDIFWLGQDESAPVEEITQKSPAPKIENQAGNNDVKNELIEALRSLSVKWGLIMSIKWARIEAYGNDVTIHMPTKFAYNSVNSPEVLWLIAQAFEKIWTPGAHIHLKC